jgi:hypothetical protein
MTIDPNLLRPGHRLRFTQSLDVFTLDHIFPKGAAGTIEDAELDALPGLPILYLRMDDVFPCLSSFKNVLQIFRSNDLGAEVTDAEFEPCGF